jgi:hypothetical protein
LEVLKESSQAAVAVIRPGWSDLEDDIRTAAATHDVVFIDGYPPHGVEENGTDTVQWLYDSRIVFPGSGAVIRVSVEPVILCDTRQASADAVGAWYSRLPSLESRIRLLDLPYYTIHNEPGEEGLVQGAADLARRAGLKR